MSRSRICAGHDAELAALREQVAEHERRLNAQDEAWTAWREANSRISGTAGAQPPRDRHGLHSLPGDAS